MEIGTKMKSNWKIKLKSGIVEGLFYSTILYLFAIYNAEQQSVLLLLLSVILICLLWEFTFPFFMNNFTPLGMNNIKTQTNGK